MKMYANLENYCLLGKWKDLYNKSKMEKIYV